MLVCKTWSIIRRSKLWPAISHRKKLTVTITKHNDSYAHNHVCFFFTGWSLFSDLRFAPVHPSSTSKQTENLISLRYSSQKTAAHCSRVIVTIHSTYYATRRINKCDALLPLLILEVVVLHRDQPARVVRCAGEQPGGWQNHTCACTGDRRGCTSMVCERSERHDVEGIRCGHRKQHHNTGRPEGLDSACQHHCRRRQWMFQACYASVSPRFCLLQKLSQMLQLAEARWLCRGRDSRALLSRSTE